MYTILVLGVLDESQVYNILYSIWWYDAPATNSYFLEAGIARILIFYFSFIIIFLILAFKIEFCSALWFQAPYATGCQVFNNCKFKID